MHQLIETKRAEIAALCREFGVVRLEVFGSAAGSDRTRPHDVDLLVEVASDQTHVRGLLRPTRWIIAAAGASRRSRRRASG
jgi:predicted nucleotidyltransferase